MKLLNIVRWMLHPLLMPLYFFLIFFFSFGMLQARYSAMLPFLLFVLFTMTIFPYITLYMAQRVRFIGNVHTSAKRDKRIIYFVMILFYVVVLKMWYDKMPDHLYLYIFFLLAFNWLVLLLGSFIYSFYSDSLFWGSILGFYTILLRLGANYSPIILIILILLPGVVSVLEIANKRTTEASLYVSYGVGFLIAVVSGYLILIH